VIAGPRNHRSRVDKPRPATLATQAKSPPLHPAQHQAVIGARGSTVMRMALMPSISFEIGDAAGTEIWRSESSQVAPALPE
jgi:hypothetical protein